MKKILLLSMIAIFMLGFSFLDGKYKKVKSNKGVHLKDRFLEFINKWSKLYRYFNNSRGKINNYCYFFKFHPKIRSYFSTTNWLERCFKDLKNNIRVRGYFHSEDSANKREK